MRVPVAALILMLVVTTGQAVSAQSPDEATAQWIRSWDAAWLEDLAFLGEGPVYAGVLVVLAAAGEGETLTRVAEAELGAAAVTWAGKVALGRSRPWTREGSSTFAGPSLEGAHHSFPSGHTSSAFALATVLADRYPRWAFLWYGAAVGVGISRIYTGDHWPTDVLAGAAIGHLAGRAALAGHPWFGFRWNF